MELKIEKWQNSKKEFWYRKPISTKIYLQFYYLRLLLAIMIYKTDIIRSLLLALGCALQI